MEIDLYNTKRILSDRRIIKDMKKSVQNTVINNPEDELNSILEVYKKLINS